MENRFKIGIKIADYNSHEQVSSENDTVSKSLSIADIPLSNLLTHGLILGMTGSGKTGLAISLLENLISENIPLIVIDPKSDLSNLLLPFDSQAAAASGLSEEKKVEWHSKLNADGISDDEINSYKDKLKIELFTPGDKNGRNLALWAFDPKKINDLSGNDKSSIQELLEHKSEALLQLLSYENINIDNPLLIFLSKILEHFVTSQESFDLLNLIRLILNPPFEQIGAIPLDLFCPSKDRQDLALKLNSVLTSSKADKLFSNDSFDTSEIFCQEKIVENSTKLNKTYIFSLRALDEKERMLFVESLLSDLIYQIRKMNGSNDLRAVLYMDEIYGYFPPVANPPAKRSMITLLKQARSQGLSLVLATQNPGDLDYKALSNISNLFIGRLNSSQDREKVTELLLANINSGIDKTETLSLLSSLAAREFIYFCAKDNRQMKIRSRQTISYLPGPMSAERIHDLGLDFTYAPSATRFDPVSSQEAKSMSTQDLSIKNEFNNNYVEEEPVVPSMNDVTDRAFENQISTPDKSDVSDLSDGVNFEKTAIDNEIASISEKSKSNIENGNSSYIRPDLPFVSYYDNRGLENLNQYEPSIYAELSIQFEDRNLDRPIERKLKFTYPVQDGLNIVDFDEPLGYSIDDSILEKEAVLKLPYSPVPKKLQDKNSLSQIQKRLVDWVYRYETQALFYNPHFKLYSSANESKEEFVERCLAFAEKEIKDLELKLKEKYSRKEETLMKSLERSRLQLEKSEMRIDREKLNTKVQSGTALINLLLGGRRSSVIGRAGSATKSHARSRELSEQHKLMEEKYEKDKLSLDELQNQFSLELENKVDELRAFASDISEKELRLMKKNIFIDKFSFYWRS